MEGAEWLRLVAEHDAAREAYFESFRTLQALLMTSIREDAKVDVKAEIDACDRAIERWYEARCRMEAFAP